MTALNKQALLIENGKLVADTLRHLADNEIDSDYFATTSTNENGTEIDHELVITDYALQAAGTVDELVRALEVAEKHIAELESLPVTPVMYSENSDADHCRQQAWKQVKDEVSTDGWSTSDSVNYFGFFCWGWDARRQYNEQRPTTVTLPEVRITVAESKRKNLTWRELGAYNEGADVAKEAILAVIRAAGIGVKGE